MSVRVACTGRRNRFDLAGRITAALAVDGRVLVIFPERYGVVARKMFEGFVPDEAIGRWQDRRPVTLADFDLFATVRLSAYDGLVVLAGPNPMNTRATAARDSAEARLATQPFAGVMVELLVPGSRPLWPQPDLVLDAMGGAD